MKSHASLFGLVTAFMVTYFCQPGLLIRACIPNPTNYCQFSQPVPVDEANVVPVVDERLQQEQPKPKIIGLLFAFLIAIAVIAYILYQIIKMLDKVIPPPEKKPDPPPNSGNTNYPPIVINPSHGPSPAVAKSYDGKIINYTNSTACTIRNYDISTYQWPNTWEKGTNSFLFDHYWTVGVRTSTNTLTWEDSNYRVECFYTTGVGVFYRYLHYGTNFYQCYYRSDYIAASTNHAVPAYFNLTDKPYQPAQFFELVP